MARVRVMNAEELHALHDDWRETWSRDEQDPPSGDWHSWLFLGGRGAGKTRAGAEWITSVAGPGVRIALVGATLHDVREVMIDGESGLKMTHVRGNRPSYEVSRRRLRWPGGGTAYAYSAEEFERLRGPQFHYAWADEFCAWPKPEQTLATLRMGLRLGDQPRLMVTTTPKPLKALKVLMAEPGVVVTRAGSMRNKVGLTDAFVEGLCGLYGGTRLAEQELEGLVVDHDGQALWRAEDLARCYGARPEAFDEVVVAVDPPASRDGDACGIVAAGRRGERVFVLEDATVRGVTPLGWATRVVETVTRHGARRVVAEANQGGEMVRAVLAQAGCRVRVELVHARVGKRARAEPVALMYERGRVTHCPWDGGRFLALEEEMMALGSSDGGGSPDRADALVWALTALMEGRRIEPRIRIL